jgi:hypothetical protein
MTLIEWLRAQLDADVAAIISGVSADDFDEGWPWTAARVLAEVKAKRAVLELCAEAESWKYSAAQKIARAVLHELAQVYAGREGWRDEWSVS